MVAFFLVIGIGNLARDRVEDHINRARLAKTPFPAFVFWFGMALEFVSAAMILGSWYPEWGAAGLIVFTVFATLIYLRYWQTEDPMRRGIQRGVFYANMAIVGGLLVVFDFLA